MDWEKFEGLAKFLVKFPENMGRRIAFLIE